MSKEEKTIRELKEMAKWSRDKQEMKTAINELAGRGEIAIPVLEEIMNVTTYDEIKAACVEAIKAVKEKKGKEEEAVKKTKGEGQQVEEKGTVSKTETVAKAS